MRFVNVQFGSKSTCVLSMCNLGASQYAIYQCALRTSAVCLYAARQGIMACNSNNTSQFYIGREKACLPWDYKHVYIYCMYCYFLWCIYIEFHECISFHMIFSTSINLIPYTISILQKMFLLVYIVYQVRICFIVALNYLYFLF